MRARSLKPGFFRNPELAKLGPYAMILFAGLWCLADREGRLLDRPERIRAEVFPHRMRGVCVEKLLRSLQECHFIERYSVDGRAYICIPSWRKHQHPHVKEVDSTIPAPGEHHAKPVLAPNESGAKTPDSGLLTPDSGLLGSHPTLSQQNESPPDQLFEPGKPGNTAGWDEFRAAYPRQTKIEAGGRAYSSRIQGTTDPEAEHGRLMAGLARHLKCQDWLDDQGQLKLKYIPAMDRFIADGLYNDNPPEWKPPARRVSAREDAITAALERRLGARGKK